MNLEGLSLYCGVGDAPKRRHSSELKIARHIKVAEAAINVIEEVERNAYCSKQNPVLPPEKFVKLSIDNSDANKSGRG